MTPAIPSAGDSREHFATEVFAHLCRAVLDQETEPARAEARLWRLPQVAVYFAYRVVTADERAAVDPVVHRLRLEAARIINQRLDRAAVRQALASRALAAARTLELRPWGADDVEMFASLLGNERVWAGLPDPYPGAISEALAADLIAISNAAPERHLVRAVAWRGHVVGQVRLQFDSSPYRDSAEISYWFGEPYWGRGLATDVVTLFTSRSFGSQPGLQRVFAEVLDGHAASMRVLEKAGYRGESVSPRQIKAGHRANVHVFGVGRDDYAAVPQEPARGTAVQAGWMLACSEIWQAAEMMPFLI